MKRKSKYLPMKGAEGEDVRLGSKVWVIRNQKVVSAKVVKLAPWARKTLVQVRSGCEEWHTAWVCGKPCVWTTREGARKEHIRRLKKDIKWYRRQEVHHRKYAAVLEQKLAKL